MFSSPAFIYIYACRASSFFGGTLDYPLETPVSRVSLHSGRTDISRDLHPQIAQGRSHLQDSTRTGTVPPGIRMKYRAQYHPQYEKTKSGPQMAISKHLNKTKYFGCYQFQYQIHSRGLAFTKDHFASTPALLLCHPTFT
ncbi:hypothetical protein LXL04_030907 [Taraxacum kok-saghyz]